MALAYRRPPNWRVPVAIVTGVLLLAIATAAIALNRIGDEAEREVSRTPVKVPERRAQDKGADGSKSEGNGKTATAPAAERKPAPKKPPAKRPPARQERPAQAPATGLVRRGALFGWPRDLKAFTVVLLSAEDRGSAERFARSASEGRPAKIGVIRADDFESLPKGFFVVFAGQYRDRPTADKAAARLGKRFSGAFPQLVAR